MGIGASREEGQRADEIDITTQYEYEIIYVRLGRTLVRFFKFIRYLLSTKKVPKKDTKTLIFYSKKAVFGTFSYQKGT